MVEGLGIRKFRWGKKDRNLQTVVEFEINASSKADTHWGWVQ